MKSNLFLGCLNCPSREQMLAALLCLAAAAPRAAATAAAPRCQRGAPAESTITVTMPDVPITVNPLIMGCHSDSGFDAQPQGFESQVKC